MTDREAEAVARVIAAADGWCSYCSAMLLQRLERKLPAVNWRRVLADHLPRALVEIESSEADALRRVIVHNGGQDRIERVRAASGSVVVSDGMMPPNRRGGGRWPDVLD